MNTKKIYLVLICRKFSYLVYTIKTFRTKILFYFTKYNFISKKMKRLLLIFTFLGFCGSMLCYAQTEKQTRREREQAWREERLKKRAETKALEEEQDSVAFEQAVQALKSGSWALEANNVNFYNGIMRFVTANTNFISMQNGQGTIQTAFNNFNYSGPNGLGGVTLQGNVWGIRLSTDSNGNVYYSFSIQGVGISATVYLTLTGGTNQASAVINPNFSGRNMTMNGFLYPYNQASIFEGTNAW